MTVRTVDPELLHRMDAYWWAANHSSVGRIHLDDDPLLKLPRVLPDVKPLWSSVGWWPVPSGQRALMFRYPRMSSRPGR